MSLRRGIRLVRVGAGALDGTAARARARARGFPDSLQEAVEQIQAVVRARGCLRVVLDGAARDLEQLEALDRAVVEVHVRERRRTEVRLPAHGLVGVD